MSVLSVVLVGDEALLCQCGEILRERGHRVVAVVTDAAGVRSWADGCDIPVLDRAAGVAEALTPLEFDWLFSIANLHVLSEAVLSLPARGAVNFHDGPLPRYAGLNTPSWAILEGATSHGVSWHRMTAGIDRGELLEQRAFELDDTETALTLNVKCFEAGMASFADLLTKIEAGSLIGERQATTERRHYLKSKRPDGAAVIDFTADVASISRLVRALDFGAGYANPLLMPKVRTHRGLFAVTRFATGEPVAGHARGSVVQVDGNGCRIAAADGTIWIEGVALEHQGELLSHVLRTGDVLPPVDADWRVKANDIVAELAPHEDRWRAAMRPAHDFSTQWPDSVPAAGALHRRDVTLPLPKDASPSDVVAVVAAFVARRFGQYDIVLGFADDATAALADRIPGMALKALPMHLHLDPDASAQAMRRTVAESFATFRARKSLLSDFFLRNPGLERPWPAVGIHLATSMAAGRPVDGCKVSFIVDEAGSAQILADGQSIDADEFADICERFSVFAAAFFTRDDRISALPIMSDAEFTDLVVSFNNTARDYDRSACAHQLIERQARETPNATAVVFRDRSITYAELDRSADAVATVLRANGVGRDLLVGLHLRRSIELVIGALAIWKAGGAYVPLDPDFPRDRLTYMVEDSHARVILTDRSLPTLDAGQGQVIIDIGDAMSEAYPTPAPGSEATPDNLAYVIYTSGSTGRPKGVMIEHRNVLNFFAGMDERIAYSRDEQPVWLAVTSLSFDISVLELFWTLARGFKVVIHSSEIHDARQPQAEARSPMSSRLDFGLFYWGNDDGAGPAKYRLMLEGAKFADGNGFQSIWTPERHFHAFGGPFPNPAVTGAAIAAVTRNLSIRAGSCVLPLHHPARIAEEWAVVDNISNGRVALAFASGWMPEDFVLRPENQPPANKAAMLRDIDTVRRLWRGESVEFPLGDRSIPVVTQPRPVQAELPFWLTTAGNPESYREAAQLGANVLTHLLGQSISELAEKIALYRRTLVECGRDPNAHKVTLMLHTLVGEDREEVRAIAREPMKAYLRSAAALIKQYAWAFPAFKKPVNSTNAMDIDLRELSADEMEAILDFAFERYFEDSGLFGTAEDCRRRLEQVSLAGVDEIACLIDFGISSDIALEGLRPLANVVAEARRAGPDEVVGAAQSAPAPQGFAGEVDRHGVTHLQATPSMMRMFLLDEDNRRALSGLQHLMIGGEPLHGSLLAELRSVTQAGVQNMYGPTETTIWSSTLMAAPTDGVVPIGLPISNTRFYVLDAAGSPVPPGMAGELHIGGDGVARGYLGRPELTAERFVPDPFADGRMYRTGDLVAFEADRRTLRFLGRTDHQVKVRGYRIELGEIEARLQSFPGVLEAVVVTREERQADVRLVAYLRCAGAVSQDALRADLASKLPDYMVPSRFIVLERFPLTPNAKIDRARLPYNEEKTVPEPVNAAPQDDIERSIASVFKGVLGLDQIRPSDNFFALGGHSLLAIQVHRELKRSIAPELTVTDLFRFPTVAGLAAHLRDRDAAGDRLGSVAQRAAMRRSRMQQRSVRV